MLASALMSILVPVALTAAPALGSAIQGDPPIRISLNQGGHYQRGDKARVEVRTDRDGYLVVLHADPEGRVRVLFPLDPNDDNYVRAGKTYEVRSRGDRESFYIEQSNGTGTVLAAVSIDPFRVTDFVVGDHWDYRNLRVSDIASDAEAELTEIIQRMGSSAGFDYDVVYYEILEPVQYAYPSVFHSSWDYWDPYYSGCYYCGSRYYGTGIHIGIGLGSGYYDPWYYDPWYYSPRYYYPGYYYPTYYYPTSYYPGYYGYGYGYRSSWPRYQNPYRFKDDRFRDNRFADNSRNRRAIDTRNQSQSRVTTNLVDYRRRSVDLSTGQRPSIQRSRDAQVRRVAPADRNSEARRVQSENGRRVAPQSSRPTTTKGAEPRRATPQRTTPNRAEPRKVEPRRATPQRTTPNRAEPRNVEPRRATPQRSTPSRAEPRRAQPSQAAPARTNSSGRRVTQAERRTSDWWTTADRTSPARRVVTGREAAATSRAVSRPQTRTTSTTRAASRPRASTPARASAPSQGRAVSRPSVSRPTPSVSRAPSSRGSSSRGSVSQGRAPSRSGAASSGGGSRRRN